MIGSAVRALGPILLVLAACAGEEPPACRLVGGAGDGAWIMIGNSLLADHDWPEMEARVVNCAIGGQTLDAALGRPLPDPRDGPPGPGAPRVLIAFGTVEAVLDEGGAAFDPDGFEADLRRLRTRVGAKWPDACVLAVTPPPADGQADQAVLRQATEAIRRMDGTLVVDSAAALARFPGTTATYDGVHLEERAYRDWADAILRRSERCPGVG